MQSPPPPPMQHPQCQTPPFFFLIPQLSHPLSTPFAPTMLLSPHRLALNRLLWNLFKYFDISPPLTSRAEMICDSWRWARSEELPLTPCPPPTPPLCRKADFLFRLASFYPSSFIHRCSSCQLVKTLKAPLIFFRLTPQCDRQTGWYSSICWHLVFAVFFVAFAQCPPTVWSCTDTMSGTSGGNPPPTFVWILLKLRCYKVTPCIAF